MSMMQWRMWAVPPRSRSTAPLVLIAIIAILGRSWSRYKDSTAAFASKVECFGQYSEHGRRNVAHNPPGPTSVSASGPPPPSNDATASPLCSMTAHSGSRHRVEKHKPDSLWVKLGNLADRIDTGTGLSLVYSSYCARAAGVLGDVDGNGEKDVVVGASFNRVYAPRRGAVWILFLNQDKSVQGQQEISSPAGWFRGGGLAHYDRFGASIAGLSGSVFDGVPDLAVGAPGDDDGGAAGANRGAVWVLFLRSNGTVRAHQKISSAEGSFTGTLDDRDYFGYSLANLGDRDSDGVPELAVGAPGDNDGGVGGGAVWILFLNTSGTVKHHYKISSTQGGFTGILNSLDMFGEALAALDLDGDGFMDLAVGAILDDDGGDARGAVWMLLLHANGTVKAHYKISGRTMGFAGSLDNGDRFGSALASVGDLDLDGVTDIAVATAREYNRGSGEGSVWILTMQSNGTVKSTTLFYQRTPYFCDSDTIATSCQGLSLTGSSKAIRSIDRVATPRPNGGMRSLSATQPAATASPSQSPSSPCTPGSLGSVVSARRYPASDAEAEDLGLTGFSQFGAGVASVGDLNSDGVGDFAVSLPFGRNTSTLHGEILVIFPDAEGIPQNFTSLRAGTNGVGSGFVQFRWLDLPVAAMRSGQPLGDDPSIPRLFAGLSQKDVGESSNAGELYIWRLRPSGVAYGERVWSLPAGMSDGAMLGASVAPMEDITGDRLLDLVVGAAGRQSVFILSLAVDDSVYFFSEIRALDLALPQMYPNASLLAIRSLGEEIYYSPLAHDLFIGDTTVDSTRGAIYVVKLLNASAPAPHLVGTQPGAVHISGSVVTIGRGHGGLTDEHFPGVQNRFGTSLAYIGYAFGGAYPVIAASITSLESSIPRVGGIYLLQLDSSSRTVANVTEVSYRSSLAIRNLVVEPGYPLWYRIAADFGSGLAFFEGTPPAAVGRFIVGARLFDHLTGLFGGAVFTIDTCVPPTVFSPSPSASASMSPTASVIASPTPSSSTTPSPTLTPSPSTPGNVGSVVATRRVPDSAAEAGALGLSTTTNFGDRLASIGDLNYDGVDDVVATQLNSGGNPIPTQIRVLFLKHNGIIQNATTLATGVDGLHTLASMPHGQPMGIDPSTARLVVGAPSTSVGGRASVGKLWIWRLYPNGSILHETTWEPPSAVGPAGAIWFQSIASLGDVTGDGLYDLVASTNRAYSLHVLALNGDDTVGFFSELNVMQYGGIESTTTLAGLSAQLVSSVGAPPTAHDLYVGTTEDVVLVLTVLNVTAPSSGSVEGTPGQVHVNGSSVVIGDGQGGFPSSQYPEPGPAGYVPTEFTRAIVPLGDFYGSGRPVIAVSARRVASDEIRGGVFLLELDPHNRTVISVLEISHSTNSLVATLDSDQGPDYDISNANSMAFVARPPSRAFGRFVFGAIRTSFSGYFNDAGAVYIIDVRVGSSTFTPPPSISASPSPTAKPSATPVLSPQPQPLTASVTASYGLLTLCRAATRLNASGSRGGGVDQSHNTQWGIEISRPPTDASASVSLGTAVRQANTLLFEIAETQLNISEIYVELSSDSASSVSVQQGGDGPFIVLRLGGVVPGYAASVRVVARVFERGVPSISQSDWNGRAMQQPWYFAQAEIEVVPLPTVHHQDALTGAQLRFRGAPFPIGSQVDLCVSPTIALDAQLIVAVEWRQLLGAQSSILSGEDASRGLQPAFRQRGLPEDAHDADVFTEIYLGHLALEEAGAILGNISVVDKLHHNLSSAAWWTAAAGSTGLEPFSSANRGDPVVTVPGSALRALHTYAFAVRAFVASIDPTVGTVAELPASFITDAWQLHVIEVGRQELQVELEGGNRSVPGNRAVEVLLSDSVDLDFASIDADTNIVDIGYSAADFATAVTTRWNCTAVLLPGETESVETPQERNCSSELSVSSDRATLSESFARSAVGYTAVIGATVTSGLQAVRMNESADGPSFAVKTGYAESSVSIVESGLPSVEISTSTISPRRYNSNRRAVVVSSSRRLVLEAVIRGVRPDDAEYPLTELGLSLLWVQTAGPVIAGSGLSGPANSPSQAGPSAVLTSPTQRRLVLASGVLRPGQVYEFAVIVSHLRTSVESISRPSSRATTRIVVNSPPTGGRLAVALADSALNALSDSPRALLDEVQVRTSGWTDSALDFPLQFSYYASSETLSMPTTSEAVPGKSIDDLLQLPSVRPAVAQSTASLVRFTMPRSQQTYQNLVNLTVIVVATDYMHSRGVAISHVMVRPTFTVQEAADIKGIVRAAETQLQTARLRAAVINTENALLSTRAASETLMAYDPVGGQDDAANELLISAREDVVRVLADTAFYSTPSDVNLQTSSYTVVAVLDAPVASASDVLIRGALASTGTLLARRVELMDIPAVDAYTAASVLLALSSIAYAAKLSDRLAGIYSKTSVEVSNFSLLLGRSMLADAVPGELPRVIEGIEGGISLAAGRLDLLGIESQVGASPVLGVLSSARTIPGGNSDMLDLAGQLCNGTAGFLDRTGDAGVLGYGLALVSPQSANQAGLSSPRARRRLLVQLLREGVDAVATKWGIDTSPHSIVTAGIEDAIGLPDVQSVVDEALDEVLLGVSTSASAQQGTKGMLRIAGNVSRATEFASLGGRSGPTVSANLLASSDGSIIDVADFGLQVCLLLPAGTSTGVERRYLTSDAIRSNQVLAIDGDVIPELPSAEPNASLSLPNQCGMSLSANQTRYEFSSTVEVESAACVFWDEENERWSGEGCQTVSVLSGGIVCRCSHLTDFSSRLELLARTERQTFTLEVIQPEATDQSQSFYIMVTLGSLLLVFGLLGAIAICLDRRDRVRFIRRLVRDPEVAVVHDLVCLEGSNDLLSDALKQDFDGEIDEAVRIATVAMKAIAEGHIASPCMPMGIADSPHNPVDGATRTLGIAPPQSNGELTGLYRENSGCPLVREPGLAGSSRGGSRPDVQDSQQQYIAASDRYLESKIPGIRMFSYPQSLDKDSGDCCTAYLADWCCCLGYCCACLGREVTPAYQGGSQARQPVNIVTESGVGLPNGSVSAGGADNEEHGTSTPAQPMAPTSSDDSSTKYPLASESSFADSMQYLGKVARYIEQYNRCLAADNCSGPSPASAPTVGPHRGGCQYQNAPGTISPALRNSSQGVRHAENESTGLSTLPTSPSCLAWQLSRDLLCLCCIRLPFHHLFLAVFTRYQSAYGRMLRLAYLLVSMLLSLAFVILLYRISGSDGAGVDVDCDGRNDFSSIPAWEQLAFSLAASCVPLLGEALLAALTSFVCAGWMRFNLFPIWRELEVRRVAELRMGHTVGQMRDKLLMLRYSLTNWVIRTDLPVADAYFQQLVRISVLLGSTEQAAQSFVEAVALDKERRQEVLETMNQRELSGTSAARLEVPDYQDEPNILLLAIIQVRHYQFSYRLRFLRSMRDYGDELVRQSRFELSCCYLVWSWGCADLFSPCLFSAPREQRLWDLEAEIVHQASILEDLNVLLALPEESRSPDTIIYLLAKSRERVHGPRAPVCALCGMCCSRGTRPSASPAAAVMDHLSDDVVASELGWTDAPKCCICACPCLVCCCNRLPSQRNRFLMQQLASDGRPYGCCHIRRDVRAAPVRMQANDNIDSSSPAGTHVSSTSHEVHLHSEHGSRSVRPAAAPRSVLHDRPIAPRAPARDAVQGHESCSLCDCWDWGLLDDLRCVCAVRQPELLGTRDIASEQEELGDDPDSELAEVQVTGGAAGVSGSWQERGMMLPSAQSSEDEDPYAAIGRSSRTARKTKTQTSDREQPPPKRASRFQDKRRLGARTPGHDHSAAGPASSSDDDRLVAAVEDIALEAARAPPARLFGSNGSCKDVAGDGDENDRGGRADYPDLGKGAARSGDMTASDESSIEGGAIAKSGSGSDPASPNTGDSKSTPESGKGIDASSRSGAAAAASTTAGYHLGIAGSDETTDASLPCGSGETPVGGSTETDQDQGSAGGSMEISSPPTQFDAARNDMPRLQLEAALAPEFRSRPDSEAQSEAGSELDASLHCHAAHSSSDSSASQAVRPIRIRRATEAGAPSVDEVDEILQEILEDTSMQAVVPGSLRGGENSCLHFIYLACCAAFVLAAVAAGAILVIVDFGARNGPDVVASVMWTFWISQGVTFLFTAPLLLLAMLVYELAFVPSVSGLFSWVPCCGTLDEATAIAQSSVLSGRLTNAALLHAVGATAGLGKQDSLLVFSNPKEISRALHAGMKQRYTETETGASAARRRSTAQLQGLDGAQASASAVSGPRQPTALGEPREQGVLGRQHRVRDCLAREFARFRFGSAARRMRELAEAVKARWRRQGEAMGGMDGLPELLSEIDSPRTVVSDRVGSPMPDETTSAGGAAAAAAYSGAARACSGGSGRTSGPFGYDTRHHSSHNVVPSTGEVIDIPPLGRQGTWSSLYRDHGPTEEQRGSRARAVDHLLELLEAALAQAKRRLRSDINGFV